MAKKIIYPERDGTGDFTKTDKNIDDTKPVSEVVRATDLNNIKDVGSGKADAKLIQAIDWDTETELKAIFENGELVNISTSNFGIISGTVISKDTSLKLNINGLFTKSDFTTETGKIVISWAANGDISGIVVESHNNASGFFGDGAKTTTQLGAAFSKTESNAKYALKDGSDSLLLNGYELAYTFTSLTETFKVDLTKPNDFIYQWSPDGSTSESKRYLNFSVLGVKLGKSFLYDTSTSILAAITIATDGTLTLTKSNVTNPVAIYQRSDTKIGGTP